MRKLLYIAIVFFVFTISGCVESLTNTNISTGDPTIEVTSPVSGDTVVIGNNEITYSAAEGSGGTGLDRVEVFVDGSSQNVFAVEDDTNPDIYIVIDSTAANSKIDYRVAVYSTSGKSATTETFDNIFVSNKPSAPTNLIISADGDNAAILVWKDNSSNETGFELWRSLSGNENYAKFTTLAKNATSYRAQGLFLQQVTYYYKVRAINESSSSAFSNEVSIGGSGSSSAPSDVSVQSQGATIAYLSWTDNSTSENGFEIQRRLAGESDWNSITLVSPNVTEYTDENLTKNTTYEYRIGALLNPTQYSSIVTVTTANSDTPPPFNVSADFNYGTRKVEVTWDNGSDNINSTRVERRTSSSSYKLVAVITTPTVTKSFIDSTFTSKPATYYYRVQHLAPGDVRTPYSDADTAYIPLLAPLEPSNLVITEIDPGKEYLLDWSDNSDDEDGFEIYYKEGSTGTYTLRATVGSNVKVYTASGLDSSKVYYFKVRAYGNGLKSDFTSEVKTPLPKPTNLQGTVITENSIQLSWEDNAVSELGFKLERRIVGTSFSTITTLGANVESFLDNTSGLFRGTSYEYRIKAFNSDGESNYSDILLITIPNK